MDRIAVSSVERRARLREAEHAGHRRVCPIAGCGAYLSRYNPGRYCSVHEPKDFRVPERWTRR